MILGSHAAARLPRRCIRPLRAGAAAMVLGLTACASDGRPADGWAGTVDTLPNGAVVVSNPESGLWRDGEEWRLVEELRIGAADGDGPNVFGSIAALAVDSLGRIYVLDRHHGRDVRVFDAGGEHLRTLGREGGGPGEFRDPIGLAFDTERRLWVADPGNARYTVYDTSGVFLASVRRPVGGYAVPWAGRFDDDGALYEWTTRIPADGSFEPVLVRVRPTDVEAVEVTDTFALPHVPPEQFEVNFDGGMMAVGIPFARGIVWHVDRRPRLHFGHTGDYRIVERSLDGDTLRVIERRHTPVPVTEADLDEHLARLRGFRERGGRIDRSRIPATKPAFTAVQKDPAGLLWVQPSAPHEDEGRFFDVFDPDGRYLGRVRAPVRLGRHPPVVLAGDALYAVVRDELDVPYVVRLRVERGGDYDRSLERG